MIYYFILGFFINVIIGVCVLASVDDSNQSLFNGIIRPPYRYLP
jgi:hypothetical protein